MLPSPQSEPRRFLLPSDLYPLSSSLPRELGDRLGRSKIPPARPPEAGRHGVPDGARFAPDPRSIAVFTAPTLSDRIKTHFGPQDIGHLGASNMRNAIIIRRADRRHPGHLNLDGRVDLLDFATLANNFQGWPVAHSFHTRIRWPLPLRLLIACAVGVFVFVAAANREE